MTEAIKATTSTDLAKVRKASVREFVERGPSFSIRLTIAANEAPSWWTPRRDMYLRKFWPSEPFLAGAIYSIASRNASYRYEFIGPERQVKRCQEMFAQADLGGGWQSMMMKLTTDLLTQDNGAFMEVIRPARVRTKELADGKWLEAVKVMDLGNGWGAVLSDGRLVSLDGYDYELKDSPMDLPIGLAHLDAGRCVRTGDPDYPITYRDLKGTAHKLSWWQVITFEDMPSPNEEMYDVGYSFVSRILRLAQTLRDIEVLKGEKAAGRFAGRIYLTNVGGDAVQDAIEESKEAADNRGLTRYMPPIIASTLEPGEIPGVATIDLASLPEGFNEDETLRWYIAGLALGGGTDYGFLAPLPGKGLGTSAQSETQERQARGKSSRLFMKMIEHKFNYSGILPRSVEFKFKETDPQEEAEQEAAKQNRAKTRALRIESGEITAQIARQMAADDGDLEQKYLELLGEEDLTPEVTVTDTDKPESDKPKVKPEAVVEAEPVATEEPAESEEKGAAGSGWFGPPKGTHVGLGEIKIDLRRSDRMMVEGLIRRREVLSSHVAGLEMVTNEASEDFPNWEVQAERSPVGKALPIRAMYDPVRRVIHMNPADRRASREFAHEFGHHVFSGSSWVGTGRGKSAIKLMKDKFGDIGGLKELDLIGMGLRKYSRTNHVEFAADCWKVYQYGRSDETSNLAGYLGVDSLDDVFGE